MINQDTLSLLEKISTHPFFKEHNVYLVGGTALAYHVKHRTSYDLDFCLPDVKELPDLSFLNKYDSEKLPFENETKDRVINDGGNIDDLQQRFLVDDIKVEFFCIPSQSEREILELDEDKQDIVGNVKIASMDAIFQLKSITLLERNKIRDLYDLNYMIKKHGFCFESFIGTLNKYKYEVFDAKGTIKLIKSTLEKRKPDPEDMKFENIDNPTMTPCDYESLLGFINSGINDEENRLTGK